MSYFNAIRQNVVADANNSSTANLAAGNSYTFTGTATSTLGVAGIQVTLFANQNCRISVQQSQDGTNWDISDFYNYTASGSFGVTVQAVSSYVRVVVTTISLTTTSFRLETALCPIVEAVPRSLDVNGNLKITTGTDGYNFEAENTPMGEARMIEPARLVGANFDGSTIDPNFWTSAASGTGATITQSGTAITLTSGTANAATVTLFSVRRARYVGGSSNRYRAVVQLGDTGTANNKRRWGAGWGSVAMPAVTDGAYFELNGTTFSVVTNIGGTETRVSSGSFNGNLGYTYTPTTNATTYEIYWTNTKVWFVVGNTVLHTVSAATTGWSNTNTLHVFADSLNSGVITAVTLKIRTATIYRLGRLETSPIFKHLTAATNTVLKYGAGRLHRIVFNTFGNGASVTLGDDTAAATTNTICITAPPNNIYPGSINYEIDFYNGLTITITGTVDLTVVYE